MDPKRNIFDKMWTALFFKVANKFFPCTIKKEYFIFQHLLEFVNESDLNFLKPLIFIIMSLI
jgi:hypothetical protein